MHNPNPNLYIRASTYETQYPSNIDICQGIYILCYDSCAMARKEKAFDRELFFRALADSTRLRIINLIGDQEVCVCFFVEILKTNQPKISRHLAYLRRAGIVTTRREGIWMHYRIATPKDENAAKVLTEVREWLANDPAMQQDRKRLARICCAPELPIQLQGSPRPLPIRVS
jgi:ArsR family transcriptional regulator, arsenate/arsenite/antimonite-responsive transcriptional repressor